MRDRVSDAMGIGELYPGNISVASGAETLLIEITVVDESPEMAAWTANTFVSEFQAYIHRYRRGASTSHSTRAATAVAEQRRSADRISYGTNRRD